MLVAGLTGSIGMGKSAAAAHLRARGIGVCDADAEVHKLYAGKAAPAIEAAFPGTVAGGIVDRAKLAAALGHDSAKFKILEKIVHPLVRDAERTFLHRERAKGARLAVLEIPLLFETGADKLVDVTIVVSAPAEVQRRRVVDERPGMTEERFLALLERQMPDAEKRRRAHFVVDTGVSLAETYAEIDAVLAKLGSVDGTAFAKHWA